MRRFTQHIGQCLLWSSQIPPFLRRSFGSDHSGGLGRDWYIQTSTLAFNDTWFLASVQLKKRGGEKRGRERECLRKKTCQSVFAFSLNLMLLSTNAMVFIWEACLNTGVYLVFLRFNVKLTGLKFEARPLQYPGNGSKTMINKTFQCVKSSAEGCIKAVL